MKSQRAFFAIAFLSPLAAHAVSFLPIGDFAAWLLQCLVFLAGIISGACHIAAIIRDQKTIQ